MNTCEMPLEIENSWIDHYTNEHLKNTLESVTVGINQNIPFWYRFEASTDWSGRFQVNLRSSEWCNTFTYDWPNHSLVLEIANQIIDTLAHWLNPEISVERLWELLWIETEEDHLYYHGELQAFFDRIPTIQ